MPPLKKLKTKSPFNILIIIIFFLSLLYIVETIYKTPKSFYKVGYKEIKGTIINCQNEENYTKIVLKSQEKILINYPQNFHCKLGIKVKASGQIKKVNSNTVFNLFNYQKYLYSQKINYELKTNTIKILNNKTSKLYTLKNSLIKHINTYKSKEYLNAFILGNNKEIDKNTLDSYRINGISHLLAISGMHITIISTILLFIMVPFISLYPTL